MKENVDFSLLFLTFSVFRKNKENERMTENEESSRVKNYRNGYSKKTVKTQLGEVDIKVPRDRNGESSVGGKY